jgi:hypothetical protein
MQLSSTSFSTFESLFSPVPHASPILSTLSRGEPAEPLMLSICICRARVGPALQTLIQRSGAASGSAPPKVALRYSLALFDSTSHSFSHLSPRPYVSKALLPVVEVGPGDLVECATPDVFYTISTIRDNNALCVIEPCLVRIDPLTGLAADAISLGWSAFPIFSPSNPLLSDASLSSSSSSQNSSQQIPLNELPLLNGSPRALAATPPGFSISSLPAIGAGCGIAIRLQRCGSLRTMRHLVADAEFFGPLDTIPGLKPTLVPRSAFLLANEEERRSNETSSDDSINTTNVVEVACLYSINNKGVSNRQPSSSPSSSSSSSPPSFPLVLAPKPALDRRLQVSLKGLRLYMPAGYEEKIVSVLRRNREVELGRPAGSLLASGVRILGRAIVIELLNGHTVVHRSACDVTPGFVTDDSYYSHPNFSDAGETALGLSGKAMQLLSRTNTNGESVQAPQGEQHEQQQSKISLGGLAEHGATLLGSESSLLLLNYAPHPCMAISISLQYAVAETTFTDAQSLGVAQRMFQRLKKQGNNSFDSSSSSSSSSVASSSDHSNTDLRGHNAHEIRSAAAATLFGGARLEQQRTILIAKQVFVPFQQAQEKGGKPKLIFANRAIRGKTDPTGENTYTRRTLEVPLSAPNPHLELTRSIYLNGAPSSKSAESATGEGEIHMHPGCFVFGPKHLIVGVDCSLRVDDSAPPAVAAAEAAAKAEAAREAAEKAAATAAAVAAAAVAAAQQAAANAALEAANSANVLRSLNAAPQLMHGAEAASYQVTEDVSKSGSPRNASSSSASLRNSLSSSTLTTTSKSVSFSDENENAQKGGKNNNNSDRGRPTGRSDNTRDKKSGRYDEEEGENSGGSRSPGGRFNRDKRRGGGGRYNDYDDEDENNENDGGRRTSRNKNGRNNNNNDSFFDGYDSPNSIGEEEDDDETSFVEEGRRRNGGALRSSDLGISSSSMMKMATASLLSAAAQTNQNVEDATGLLSSLLMLPVLDASTRLPRGGPRVLTSPLVFADNAPLSSSVIGGGGKQFASSSAMATSRVMLADGEPIVPPGVADALEAALPFPLTAAQLSPFGRPLSLTDVARLQASGMPARVLAPLVQVKADIDKITSSSSSSSNSEVSDNALLRAMLPPLPNVELELSDTFSAYSFTITFAAFTPNLPSYLTRKSGTIKSKKNTTTGGIAASSECGSNAGNTGSSLLDVSLMSGAGLDDTLASVAIPEDSNLDSHHHNSFSVDRFKSLSFGFQLFSSPFIRTEALYLTEPAKLASELEAESKQQRREGGRREDSSTGKSAAEEAQVEAATINNNAFPNAPKAFTLSLTKDGSSSSFLSLRIDIDPTVIAPGERRNFAHYLSTRAMHIEVWDGESHIPVGVCAVQLAHLMRQQKKSVHIARSFDVVSSAGPYALEAPNLAGVSSSSFSGIDDMAAGFSQPITGSPVISSPSTDLTGNGGGVNFHQQRTQQTLARSALSAGYVIGRLQLILTSEGKLGQGRFDGGNGREDSSASLPLIFLDTDASSPSLPLLPLVSSTSNTKSETARKDLSSTRSRNFVGLKAPSSTVNVPAVSSSSSSSSAANSDAENETQPQSLLPTPLAEQVSTTTTLPALPPPALTSGRSGRVRVQAKVSASNNAPTSKQRDAAGLGDVANTDLAQRLALVEARTRNVSSRSVTTVIDALKASGTAAVCHLFPSYGKALLVEFTIRNPFDHADSFAVVVRREGYTKLLDMTAIRGPLEEDVRVLTDPNEIAFFKANLPLACPDPGLLILDGNDNDTQEQRATSIWQTSTTSLSSPAPWLIGSESHPGVPIVYLAPGERITIHLVVQMYSAAIIDEKLAHTSNGGTDTIATGSKVFAAKLASVIDNNDMSGGGESSYINLAKSANANANNNIIGGGDRNGHLRERPLAHLSSGYGARGSQQHEGGGGEETNPFSLSSSTSSSSTLSSSIVTRLVTIESSKHGCATTSLRIVAKPRPFPIHRTIRYFHSENSYLRSSLPLPSPGPMQSHNWTGCVACADPDAIVQVSSPTPADYNAALLSGLDTYAASSERLLIRYKCGGFPSTRVLHVVLYEDAARSSIREIWRVVVHSLYSFDVHTGQMGQKTEVDLVVRGPPFGQKTEFFSSHPQEISLISLQQQAQLQPSQQQLIRDKTSSSSSSSSIVSLVPGALNRLPVTVRMLEPPAGGLGSTSPRPIYLTLVDSETKELVSAWRASITSSPPSVSRVYDILAPVMVACRKRVQIVNAWARSRELTVVSSRPHLVSVLSKQVHVEAKREAPLRLQLLPVSRPSATYVLLFVLDETGAAEETLLLRLRFIEREAYKEAVKRQKQ